MHVRRIAVLGAGEMGHGIAELAALRGFEVRLRDVDAGIVEKALGKVRWSLDKLAEKAQVTKEDAAAAIGRLRGTTDLAEALEGADLVIEAVPERLDLKRKVFAEVERLAPAACVLATNTSGMQIAEIGEGLRDPSRLVGMHFFNPVLLMDLVEVVPSDKTAPDATATAVAVARALGKKVVVCRKDVPGFITTRLVGAFFNAAGWLVHRRVATKEQVDAALRFQAGFPMGPFELADLAGLDVARDAGQYVSERLGPAYRAAPVVEELVREGRLGTKVGRGFYDYAHGRPQLKPADGEGFDPAKVLAVVANEAAKLMHEGVGTAAEIDEAMRLGCAFPKGPLAWADERGLDVVLKTLLDLKEESGLDAYEPAEPLVSRVDDGHLGKKTGKGFHEWAEPSGAETRRAYGTLRVDKDGSIAVVTLDRPHRLNAIDAEMTEDIARCFVDLAHDRDVRAVVVIGSGEKAFCVGADLASTADIDPGSAAQMVRRAHLAFLAIEKCPKPVVAALNGYAFGGGFELAMACDFRVAARRVELALPEVKLGLLPAAGGTQRLPRLVGLARAKEIALLGGRHKADEALAWGLVTSVVDNDRVLEEAKALARRLAENAPLALAKTKMALHAAFDTPIQHGMEIEANAFGLLLATEDAVEGVSAMFAKRKPEFKGK